MNKAQKKYKEETGLNPFTEYGLLIGSYKDWLEDMVEKQLNIHSVIKSFYCYDKDTQEGACKYQCDECIDLDDNI